MTFPPIPPPGQTPLRVMTIAGSDSGGGAGIQADLRTFALLGMHGLVAVTAVTVQNSLGVKGFHEIPLDVIAGQIEAVAGDIGLQAAKTGMLASSDIIDTVAETWVAQGLAGTVPLVVDPVCASMHGDPLLHPSALDSLTARLFPLATLVTPNLDEVRLHHRDRGRRRRQSSAPRRALCMHWAPGGRWSRAAICARRRTARTCSSTAPSSTSSTPCASTPGTTTAPATHWPPRPPAHWRTATRCPMPSRSPNDG